MDPWVRSDPHFLIPSTPYYLSMKYFYFSMKYFYFILSQPSYFPTPLINIRGRLPP